MNRPLLGFKLICLVVTLCYTYQGLLISPGLFYAPFILGFPLHTAAQRKSVWQLFSCNALERALLLEEQEPFRIFWKSVLYMYVGLLVALFLRGMTFTSVPQVASFFVLPVPYSLWLWKRLSVYFTMATIALPLLNHQRDLLDPHCENLVGFLGRKSKKLCLLPPKTAVPGECFSL